MNDASTPPAPRDELGPRELLPYAFAAAVLFVALVLEATKTELRIYAAFAAVVSARWALLDVINEQYRRAAKRAGRPADADAFSARGFLAKQQARLWGLLTVTATGASFLGVDRGLWTLAIVLAVAATVVLNVARAVRRYPPDQGLSARTLATIGGALLAGAALALVLALT